MAALASSLRTPTETSITTATLRPLDVRPSNGSLEIRPITLRAANAFVEEHHRSTPDREETEVGRVSLLELGIQAIPILSLYAIYRAFGWYVGQFPFGDGRRRGRHHA